MRPPNWYPIAITIIPAPTSPREHTDRKCQTLLNLSVTIEK